jgi:lysine-specific demethylase/histidyl-hydroxylase NO66
LVSSLQGSLGDPLRWLLGEQADGFLTEVYERKPVVVRHNDPDRFRPLLSLADIDSLVAELDFQRGMLVMTDASRTIAESEYVAPSGAVDRGAVASLYSGGATLILNQLQQSHSGMASLCRSLESVFSCHVQTNTYLTPPSSQGFRTHYDNHDVLVIQIEGEKAWRLHDQPVAIPYRGEGFQPGVYPVGELSDTFVLRAGDCAYVPRGLMHDAATSGDKPSLHITCGLIVRTWADVILEAVSEVCVKDEAFRRSLPPGFANPSFDRAAMADEFQNLIHRLADKARLDHALDFAIREFVVSRESDVSGALLGAHAPLAPAYVARPSIWRIEEEEFDGTKTVLLIAPGGELSFPGLDRASLERALSGTAFTPQDLGVPDPAPLIRRLVAAGLIGATSA